jgi:hypothetical protein
MKKVFYIALAGIGVCMLAYCGNTRPDGGTTTTVGGTTGTTVAMTTTTVSRFDDTEWQNVLNTLKECLKAEQANSIPSTKLEAGKALALAAKFMKANLSIPQYGFTRNDINLYVQRARMMFEAVSNDPTSTAAQKNEAKAEIAKLSSI